MIIFLFDFCVQSSGEPEVRKQDSAKTAPPAALVDTQDDHQDGSESRLDKETPEANSTDAADGKCESDSSEILEAAVFPLFWASERHTQHLPTGECGFHPKVKLSL